MKVVLLLDTSLTSCEQAQDDCINEPIIIALRLLSFLWNRHGDPCCSEGSSPRPSPKTKSKRTPFRLTNKRQKHGEESTKGPDFKWGFKFFSSIGSVVRAKLSKKTSFTTVWNSDSFGGLQKNAEAAFKNERDTADKRTSLTHPSERLATALTEILHDFEWLDKSDLLKSPGRSLRKKTSHIEVDESHKDKQNVVFIFSRAPSSRQCLRRFSNKLVIDSDVFIDSFMSPALMEEYKDKSMISIYWVDFNSPQVNVADKDTRNESLNIVMESFRKLGGNLLHKCDILKYFPSDATFLSFNDVHPPIATLPSEISLLQLSNKRALADVPPEEFVNSVFVKGSCKLELIGAKLTPFMNVAESMTSESPYETSAAASKSAATSKNETSDDRASLSLSDTDIDLQGCMPVITAAELVSNLEMHRSTVLTCDNDSRISTLLQMLIKSQNLAILKISRNQDFPFQMAILTALTSTCGHIFIVSRKQQVSFEKALFFKSTKDSSPIKQLKFTNPFNSHVLNSWHKPGSIDQLAHLIGDLKNRASTQNVSSSVANMLTKVREMYLSMKQKQQQQCTLVTSTPISGLDSSLPNKIGGSAESESGSSSSQTHMRRGLSRRSSSSLSRGRLLVERARSASMLMAGDEECSNQSLSRVTSPAGRRTSGSVGFESLNIQNAEELLDYLKRQYIQVLSAGVAMEASIQAMLTVTCYFMSTKELATNPQKSAIAFIRKHLSLDPTKLKEKYGKASDVDKRTQTAEYKLQVLLLLEMASFVPDNEDFQGEKLLNALVSMLRVLSFIVGPSGVRELMANATDSHCGTLPQVLMDVYDELDLPYPGILAKLTSPSAPSTVWGPNTSVGSVDSFHSGPYSSQPPSSGRLSQGTRRTSLKQHPSLTDFRQKKQILMEKPKSKPESKTEGKKSAKDKSKPKGKGSKSKSAVDLGRAKRNLFSDKSKVKKAKDRVQLTPKGKSGRPKLLVPGTPSHKQTSERILSRQKRLRDHLNIKPDVQVVAESPVKDDDPHERVDNKPARFLLRESFYSTNSQQSRIVAKSMEMEEKGGRPASSPRRFLHPSRSHGSLISAVRGESPILSPRSRMMKSFLSSPSSEGKSLQKKLTIPISSTPPSHLPRRSPRKSVKKLLFHNTMAATTSNTASASACQGSSKQQGMNATQNSLLDAKLVFDGENASDALPALQHSRAHNVFELKTPEKRSRPKFCAWDTSSCPPFQVTPTKSKPRKQVRTPELSFKNVFNAPSTSNKSPEPQYIRRSPTKNLQNISDSPLKFDSGYDFHKNRRSVSGSVKTRLKKSASDSVRLSRVDKDFVNLQKRISPQKAMGKGPGMTKRVSGSSLRLPDPKKSSRHGSFSNSTNRFESLGVDDGDIVLSTPKKTRYDSNHPSFHTTPSKVKFSDSFLISPPTGSGHPMPVTPTRSILKGSPSKKIQSFVRRIELPDSGYQKLQNTNFLSPNSKKTPVASSPNKMSKRQRTSLMSPSKQNDRTVKSQVNRFDQDSSSSSCESSFNASQAHPSTVVTAHTPSPSHKSKNPESINTWMRKKRNSGSRTVSSSSSSSVSPSSSNEFKEKVSGQGMETSQTSVNMETVKYSEVPITDGKNLKRNLFSTNAVLSSGCSPRKRGKGMIDNNEVLSSKTKEGKKIETAIKKGKGKGKGKNSKLYSHTSGGFSKMDKGAIQCKGELMSDEMASIEEPSHSSGKSSSATIQQSAPFSCFSPSRSPSKRRRVFQQNTSCMGESSQGFTVDSENNSGLHIPSTHGEVSARSKSDNVTHSPPPVKLSVDGNKSPGSGKATPVKKQQYSPALTTSGLLQLIRSPLLEETKANANNAKGRSKRSAKSRKHLDWPL